MAAPQINVNVLEVNVFAPQVGSATVGMVGPSSRGPLNTLTPINNADSLVNEFGRPVNARYYNQRTAYSYLEEGSNLLFTRIAGQNLVSPSLSLNSADGDPILLLTANSPGTWANDLLKVAVTHNGAGSYNILVYYDGGLVESFLAQDNGIVVTTINSNSLYLTVVVQPGSGTTFPASTVDVITGAVDRLPFAGGDDGALAKTDSAGSSTGGIVGKRFHGQMGSTNGDRVWENLHTIDNVDVLAGLTDVYGSVGMPVTPGSFTIRVESGAGVYQELSDSADGGAPAVNAGAGLGLLEGDSAHVGFVDYRTGQWGVQLSGGPTTFLTGSIDAIWMRANSEGVGTTTPGDGEYGGNLSSFPLGVGYLNANKTSFFLSVSEQVGDTAGAAGAVSSEAALKTLAGWIVPGTIKLTLAHATLPVPPVIWDDGFGGWRTGPLGTGVSIGVAVPNVSDFINYRLGTWDVGTWDPVGGVVVPAAAQLSAEYDIQIIDQGGGAVAGPDGVFVDSEVVQPSDAGGDALAASTDGGAQNAVGPLSLGSVKLTLSSTGGGAGSETFYDDGLGGWLDKPRGDPRAVAAAAGAIDYVTGAWSITAAASIDVGAVIDLDYVRTPQDKARRSLRGTGPQFVANATPNVAGMDLSDPSATDTFNGPNFLDHRTGEFNLKLDLVTAGVNTFNLKDTGPITAVYVPASILGFGDGTTTVFTGDLAPAPFRREDNRLWGFQGGQNSNALAPGAAVGVASELQVTFSEAASVAADDHWLQNVALPSDPDNTLNFATGETSIQWTGAPSDDEAVYVVAEEAVLHFTSRYPGDIGNERTILTDGLYIAVGADPNQAGTLRAQVWFDGAVIESFGLATTLEELVDSVNDPVNGSDFITARLQDAGNFLPVDTDAAQLSGMSGAFTIADVIGAKVGRTFTGMQIFSNHELVEVDFVSIPGQWHRQVIEALRTLCEAPKRHCVGVFSIPQTDYINEDQAFLNGHWGTTAGNIAVAEARVPFPPLLEINSSQLISSSAWGEQFDQFAAENVIEPPDAQMMRLISRARFPWIPIAGFRRGQVAFTDIVYSAALEDRDLVQGLVGDKVECVNPIVRKFGRGLFLMGEQTCNRTPGSALNDLNVRWTVNFIMRQIETAFEDFYFEINDEITWREATALGNSILAPILELRGITEGLVQINGSTMTPADVDNGILRGKFFIKPSRSIKQLWFDLIITSQSVSFESIVGVGGGL